MRGDILRKQQVEGQMRTGCVRTPWGVATTESMRGGLGSTTV